MKQLVAVETLHKIFLSRTGKRWPGDWLDSASGPVRRGPCLHGCSGLSLFILPSGSSYCPQCYRKKKAAEKEAATAPNGRGQTTNKEKAA